MVELQEMFKCSRSFLPSNFNVVNLHWWDVDTRRLAAPPRAEAWELEVVGERRIHGDVNNGWGRYCQMERMVTLAST